MRELRYLYFQHKKYCDMELNIRDLHGQALLRWLSDTSLYSLSSVSGIAICSSHPIRASGQLLVLE